MLLVSVYKIPLGTLSQASNLKEEFLETLSLSKIQYYRTFTYAQLIWERLVGIIDLKCDNVPQG